MNLFKNKKQVADESTNSSIEPIVKAKVCIFYLQIVSQSKIFFIIVVLIFQSKTCSIL